MISTNIFLPQSPLNKKCLSLKTEYFPGKWLLYMFHGAKKKDKIFVNMNLPLNQNYANLEFLLVTFAFFCTPLLLSLGSHRTRSPYLSRKECVPEEHLRVALSVCKKVCAHLTIRGASSQRGFKTRSHFLHLLSGWRKLSLSFPEFCFGWFGQPSGSTGSLECRFLFWRAWSLLFQQAITMPFPVPPPHLGCLQYETEWGGKISVSTPPFWAALA